MPKNPRGNPRDLSLVRTGGRAQDVAHANTNFRVLGGLPPPALTSRARPSLARPPPQPRRRPMEPHIADAAFPPAWPLTSSDNLPGVVALARLSAVPVRAPRAGRRLLAAVAGVLGCRRSCLRARRRPRSGRSAPGPKPPSPAPTPT